MATTDVPIRPDDDPTSVASTVLSSGVEEPPGADSFPDGPDALAPASPSPADAAGFTGKADPVGAEEPDPDEEARWQRRHKIYVSISTWVMCIGALVILFAAWQLWGTAIEQHHSQDDLAKQFSAKVHHAHPSFSLLPATANLPVPPEGGVVALLQIPALGISQFVVEGTGTDDLAKGPGHYSGTAAPGQGGNVAIAGHRTTHGAPFNQLGNLKPGDPIYLTDLAAQRLTYIVAFPPFPVDPSNVSVLNYFGDNRLTLTTCNPPYSAAQRLIVVAGFKSGPGAAQPLKHRAEFDAGQLHKVTISGEAGWNTGLFPVVFLEIALLVLLGLTNRRWARILGRESKWLILVPIWAALIYLFFQTLSNFLPAAA